MTAKQKQCLLAYLGYDTGGVDGIWGTKSMTATEAFQNAYGIGADGIFGPATEKKILEVVASGEQPTPVPTGTFWNSIQYFQRDEFRCPCPRCGGFPVEPEEKLVKIADRVREHFGKPVTISSGVRCQAHNREVGGVANSRHLLGKAMDFCVQGMSAAAALPYLQSLVKSGELRYAYAINESYIHMDVV